MARLFAAALVMLAVMLGAGTAQAADPREKEALAAYARGDYKAALETFAQLYADTHHATYLRNIGRCYQALGEPDKAIASFREYLVQAKGITPEKRQEVEGFIREMEDLKAKQAAERQSAEPPPAPPSTPPPAIAPQPAPPAAVVVAPAPARAPMPARRKAAIASVAAGAAAVVVGTVFGLLARSAYHDSDGHCSPNNVCDEPGLAARDKGFDRALVSTIAFAAGAAGIGAGVGLWLSTPEPNAHAALGAGATWTARW